MSEGLRIYNLFPTLAGSIRKWTTHLPRIAAMGFDAVYLNPFHYPGFSGSLYAVKDYYRLNPRFRGGEADDDSLLRGFTAAARGCGLRVIMDLVVNHTSRDNDLVASHPHWFSRDARGNVISPHATDPADPSQKTVWGDLAELDYRPPQQRQILAYFQQLVRHYIALGFGGFRCDAAYKVPAEVWRGLIDEAKKVSPDVLFCAENLGDKKEAVLALTGAGLGYLFKQVTLFREPMAARSIRGLSSHRAVDRLSREPRYRAAGQRTVGSRGSGLQNRASLSTGLCLCRRLLHRRNDADGVRIWVVPAPRCRQRPR